ncbi:MAG: hypothetical protein HQL76_01385 [Magnetococcales bacterium]|nr:hypothetical protein [Magnetococcales bacterium]
MKAHRDRVACVFRGWWPGPKVSCERFLGLSWNHIGGRLKNSSPSKIFLDDPSFPFENVFFETTVQAVFPDLFSNLNSSP